jgi:hypothetical protein
MMLHTTQPEAASEECDAAWKLLQQPLNKASFLDLSTRRLSKDAVPPPSNMAPDDSYVTTFISSLL